MVANIMCITWLLAIFVQLYSLGALAAQPLVERCGPSGSNIVCVNRYSAILPTSFYRPQINNSWNPENQLDYTRTYGVNASDATFELLSSAEFIIWNKEAALPLLGGNVSNEFMFKLTPVFTDAPVYVPTTNELYFSPLAANILPQNVVDLKTDPPTLNNKTAKPILYSAEGGVFFDGLIYYAVGGNNASYDTRPGVYTLDPTTSESSALVNNYYGWYFNGVDDLTIDPINQDIWFTDNSYARDGVNDYEPALPMQTYRFNRATGEVRLVEDTLQQPNGIGFSPDGNTLYLTDSGALVANYRNAYFGFQDYNVTSPHTVYAFDVRGWPEQPYLVNKRPIYITKEWIPDGLRVSREGYLLVGAGSSLDILTPMGSLIMSIQTNYTAVNCNFAGQNLDELWIVGVGGVSRVRGLNLHGQTMFA